jgi:hypothetical protein
VVRRQNPWLGWVAQSAAGLILAIGPLVAAAPLTLPARAPESAVAPPDTRAMWVWQPAAPSALVSWAVSHGVRTIFVYVDQRALDVGSLTELRRRCDAAGILLDALGGEPGWTSDHATAFAWRRAVDGLGLFHGVHVDVEPYLLDGWATDRAHLVGAYLRLLDGLRGPAGPAGEYPLEVDVPFWFGTVPVGARTLADEVLDRVDGVTVMSYRDTATGANSMVEVSRDLLARAGKAAKPARLAAETQPLPDCSYCSFHGDTQQVLAKSLTDADGAARRFSAFAGIAVHQYSTWSALPR